MVTLFLLYVPVETGSGPHTPCTPPQHIKAHYQGKLQAPSQYLDLEALLAHELLAGSLT